ncbi:hypothetical protein DOY81_013315, partial [Sarcophaga bullata]
VILISGTSQSSQPTTSAAVNTTQGAKQTLFRRRGSNQILLSLILQQPLVAT